MLVASEAFAGRFRVRAREHYETIKFDDGDASKTYKGFTNTINAWYEEPFQYAVGFAGSPIFARLFADQALPGFAPEVRLVHLGVEGKMFPAPEVLSGFLRGGVYQSQLTSNGEAGRMGGSSYLVGVGYEFNFDGIGVAPEASWRGGNLDDEVRFSGSAPCIGVHFYKQL